jgi:hypothetical protein
MAALAGPARSALAVVSVCLWIAAVALGLTRRPVAGVADFNIGDAVVSLVFLTFAGVGTLIVTRRPGNLIGWLFLMV